MIKPIYIPNDLGAAEVVVKSILLERGARLRRDLPLLELDVKGEKRVLVSPYNGWLRIILTKAGRAHRAGEVVLHVDVVESVDYRPDSAEFNQKTELGSEGRRGLEREGQKAFAKAYSAPLFDAPERGEGQGNRLPQNPLMQNMKEGVPPKMQASAASNQPAIDKMSEEATHDPQLRQQLSLQLQQELNISPAPSVAPTPRAGGG